LRSKLNASFVSGTDLGKQASVKGTSSPDLTHIRTVKVGDTLPAMCQAIYKDSSYYIKVARFNNLINFRKLEPGTEITFPPVI
jgi:nucleoid-associated protein YgaU